MKDTLRLFGFQKEKKRKKKRGWWNQIWRPRGRWQGRG